MPERGLETMKKGKRTGGIAAVLIVLIVLAAAAASGFFVLETLKKRNLAQGTERLNAQDYTAAKEYLTKADKYSLRPDEEILKGLAVCHFETNESEEAKRCYEKLIALDAKNAEYRYELGKICVRTKDYETAEQQIHTLREMKTPEASKYAYELTSAVHSGKVKGIFQDLLEKIAPGLGDIPGLGGGKD